jgi:hypothetical protein
MSTCTDASIDTRDTNHLVYCMHRTLSSSEDRHGSTRIDGSVLVACGDVDVVADPWLEPTAYRGSRHVTLAVVPRMAHMHNFAVTRRRLWDLLDGWAVSIGRATTVRAGDRSS